MNENGNGSYPRQNAGYPRQGGVYPRQNAGYPQRGGPAKGRGLTAALIAIAALLLVSAGALAWLLFSPAFPKSAAARKEEEPKSAADTAGHVHDWGEWSVETPAGCDCSGVEVRICRGDASHRETRELPPLGHSWEEADYSHPRRCTRCGLEEGEPLELPLSAEVSGNAGAPGTQIYPSSADASSFINSNHIGEAGVTVRYPSSAIDGSAATSWQEQATGYGVGQWITVYFDGPKELRYICFCLGNWESDGMYRSNGRPSELKIEFSDGSSVSCVFADEMKEYRVTLSKSVSTDSVKITILGAYPGSVFEDTCISEISFYG